MLVDNIIIKILISEQLSQLEKQEMLNAYNSGKLKKQYRQYAKAYHPDRNPDPSAVLTFQELGNINAILKKLEDGEPLSRNDVETMIDMVGQQKAFTISGFKEAYDDVMFDQQQQQRPQQRPQQSPINTEKYKNINTMSDFVKVYKQDLINANRVGPGSNMESFERIMAEFEQIKNQNFPRVGDSWAEMNTNYISSLGGEGETRDAFVRSYNNAKNEMQNRRMAYDLGLEAMKKMGFPQFLEKYIDTAEAASLYLSKERAISAIDSAKTMLFKIQQIEGIANAGDISTAKSYYEEFKNQFEMEGASPGSGILSYDLLSNLDTGLDLRDHAFTLFSNYSYEPDDFVL